MTKTIQEKTMFRLFLLFGIFILVNFNQDLGMIYAIMMLTDFVWWQTDTKVSFPFEKNAADRPRNIAKAVVAYGGFLMASMFLVEFLAVSQTGMSFKSLNLLLSQSTPILKDNVILTFLGWGIMVPVIETRFFHGRLQEGLAELFSKRLNRRVTLRRFNDSATILVILIVASLFTLFHLTAKNLESVPLIISFIFSIVSSILVIHDGETFSASALHVLTNMVAVAAGLGFL